MSSSPTLKIEMLPVNDLNEYEGNARQHGEKDIDAIKESIKSFGFNDPIGIWKDNIIIEGHGRLMAARALGMTEVPIIRLDHLTDEERRAYALAHNKTAELSGWNFQQLDLELAGIQEFDMSKLGFYPLTAEPEVIEDDYDFDKEPEVPEIQVGDLYQLGDHRLICGDSTDPDVIKRLMGGCHADMVFTDPPYGMGLNTDWSSAKSKLQFFKEKRCNASGNTYDAVIGDNADFKPELITSIFDNFADTKEIFIWGADYYPELLFNFKEGNIFVWDKRSNDDTEESYVAQTDKMYGSQFELCWSKSRHRKQIARVKWAGIFGTEVEFDHKRVHPTQKPANLAAWFITRYSKDNSNVVDMYGGSGSTLLACEQTGRRCFMCELDPYYCSVIIDRWEALTGRKAERIN